MADNKKKYCGVERTLVVFKPDAVQRGIVGEILQRFERVGLKMVGVKMAAPDREHYYHHYEDIGKMVTRRDEDTFRVSARVSTPQTPTTPAAARSSSSSRRLRQLEARRAGSRTT